VLGALAALALAVLVTLLVVRNDDGDDKQVAAGTSTSSSSSTTTSSSTTSSTTTSTTALAPTTTAAVATTAPPTTAVLPVVTGQGAALQAPASADTRTMVGSDCTTLADAGWTPTCGAVTAKAASLVWLLETQETPSGRTGRRALVLRKGTGSSWSVVLQVRDDSGVRYGNITTRVSDVSGDGRDEIVFGFHSTVGQRLVVDMVEGPGSVVVHRDLAAGVARVSSGQLDTWRRTDASHYAHEVIQLRDGAWRIVASASVPPSDVPPSQL
jgi:hypothetical protein